MRQDVEAAPPSEEGAILNPPSPAVAPKATDPLAEPSDPTTSLIESVRKVFAPCVGVVDAASIFMGNCRFGKDAYDHTGGGDGIHMRLRNGTVHTTVQKRQGETLEIPANGGFDDDVSAISAHTLEEMERLRQAQQKSKLQMLTPPSTNSSRKPKLPTYRPRGTGASEIKEATRGAFTTKQLWSQPRHTTGRDHDEECSIGVSTSGSSSAEDEPSRITTRDSKQISRRNLQSAKRTA
jgi:hypothetical protein